MDRTAPRKFVGSLKGKSGLRRYLRRTQVQLCWLALLLIRVVENATADTWRNVRDELQRMHLITLASADGQVDQRSATTPGQKTILSALQLLAPAPAPPNYLMASH